MQKSFNLNYKDFVDNFKPNVDNMNVEVKEVEVKEVEDEEVDLLWLTNANDFAVPCIQIVFEFLSIRFLFLGEREDVDVNMVTPLEDPTRISRSLVLTTTTKRLRPQVTIVMVAMAK